MRSPALKKDGDDQSRRRLLIALRHECRCGLTAASFWTQVPPAHDAAADRVQHRLRYLLRDNRVAAGDVIADALILSGIAASLFTSRRFAWRLNKAVRPDTPTTVLHLCNGLQGEAAG